MKRSVANLTHGLVGTSCPNCGPICLESFRFAVEYFRQTLQFVISSFKWLFMFGQYTVVHARITHFCNPKWPWCICAKMSGWSHLGINSCSPFKSNPSSIAISSRNVQKGRNSGGNSVIFCGHPHCTVCFRSARVSSFAVDCRSFSSLSWVHLACAVIWFICKIGSVMVSLATGALDKQSAIKFVSPLMYSTFMS